MITEATVISTDGEIAVVENNRKSACDGCHKNAEGGGCSVCSLTGPDRKITTKAYNKIGAQAGDKVAISTGTGRVLSYALMVFLMPLLFAVLGWWIGGGIFSNEKLGYILTAGGFVISFLLVWLYSRFVVSRRCDAEIISILQHGETSGESDKD